jgi:hypothetical protein
MTRSLYRPSRKPIYTTHRKHIERIARYLDPDAPPKPKRRKSGVRRGPPPTLTVEYHGSSTPLADLARAHKVPAQRIYKHIFVMGWAPERALATPPLRKRRQLTPEELTARRADTSPPAPRPPAPIKYTYDKNPRGRPVTVRLKYGGACDPQPLRDIARANGIPYQALYARVIQLGWPLERALSQPVFRKRKVLATVVSKMGH